MPFEYAVRPFQSRDAQGRIIIPSAPGGFDQRATLTWGAKTKLDAMGNKGISVTGRWPNNIETACVEESVQQKNTMKPATIQNEGPNGGVVEVERADTLELNKDETATIPLNGYNLVIQGPATIDFVQVDYVPAPILKEQEPKASQIGAREVQTQRCGVTASFNHV